MSVFVKPMLAASGAASLMLCSLGGALSQTPAPAGNGATALPTVVVEPPKQVARTPRQKPRPREVARRAVPPRTAPPTPTAPTSTPTSPAARLAAKSNVFD